LRYPEKYLRLNYIFGGRDSYGRREEQIREFQLEPLGSTCFGKRGLHAMPWVRIA
jgi:hypothetical protein